MQPANPPPVIERKLKPDGSIREYVCELVRLEPSLAVVRFRMERGGEIFGTPITVPPGSISYGWFWRRRPYNLYRMHTRQGDLIAHRFDVVADVSLSPELIEYRDLVVDWWITPDDTIIEEDRDELAELEQAGKLRPADLETIAEATRQVYSRYRHIIDEVAFLERRFGIDPTR